MLMQFGWMLAIGVTWLIAEALLIGVGLWVYRLWGQHTRKWEDLLLVFWLGFAIVIGMLQLWHFFLPIDGRATLVVALIGFGGLLWHRQDLTLIWLTRQRFPWWFMLGNLVFVVWLANRATGYPYEADSAYYHLSSILWNKHYSVVPGLANLSASLGYNSSFFRYAALLDVGIWNSGSYHIVNTLLMFVFGQQIATALWQVVRSFRNRLERIPLSSVFLLFVSSFAIVATGTVGISSPNNDYPVTLLVYITLWIALRLIEEKPANEVLIAAIWLLSAAAITIKVNVAVYFAGLSLWGLGYGIHQLGWRRLFGTRALRISLVILGIVSASWLMTGIMLSGYLLFPNPALSVPVDWRVSYETADATNFYVRIWGYDKSLKALPQDLSWLPGWFKSAFAELSNFTIPLFSLLCASGLGILQALRGQFKLSSALVLMLPPLAALAFLMIYSPQVRFMSGLLLGSAALALALIVDQWRWPIPGRIWQLVMLIMCLLLLYPVYFETRLGWHWLSPGDRDGLYSLQDQPIRLAPFTTASGLVIQQPLDGACWMADLLCTPFPSRQLDWRVEGDVAHGFRRNSQ
jgi:hypothetical protein